MDKDSIKENGLLEQYLLGELSEKESNEVEEALKGDEELRTYFNELEANFQQLAFENAITPPGRVKASLMDIVNNEINEERKVIPIKTRQQQRFSIPFAAAASLAFIFFLSSAWLYNNWKTTQSNLESLRNETSDLRSRITTIEEDYDETNKWYQAINQPDAVQLVLKGNDILPDATAITYVNHQDKTVILNTQGLPELAEDKDYQMWADVDGVMINMGVIPSDVTMTTMKYIDDAHSINITIEPAGGNDHPTVEQLISNVIL
ncbi:hypothetical protein GTQ40_08770 [Flavobacteriaceae bacterium R38]|nr:hypothetical protein [Flavobacteriaceae bacterium R38]